MMIRAPYDDEKKVKLLVGIVGRADAQKVSDICADSCVSLHYIGQALGTATGSYRSFFGFDEIEKSIVLNLIPEYCERRVMSLLNQKMKLYLPGNGIAFTISLTGIGNIIGNAILSTPESRGEMPGGKAPRKKEKKHMHELIVAVVNQKYTDLVLSAARGAGATGATLLHTLGFDNKQAEQVLGTVLKQETDTVAILTTQDFKGKILGAITDVAGLKTDGGAVVFSLPVDELIGIGRFAEEDEEK